MYFSLNYERDHIFMGGGCNLSLFNFYKLNRESYGTAYYNKENKVKNSFLTESFNDQFELSAFIGARIKLSDRLMLMPLFEITFANSLYPTNIEVRDWLSQTTHEVRINSLLYKFGLITEIGFCKK